MSELGTCVWFEIPVTSEKNTQFYQDVFGWKLKRYYDATEESRRHRLWHAHSANGRPIGGIYVDEEHVARRGTEFYVTVENMDPIFAETVKHQGKVDLGKTQVPEGEGYFARIADPDGNLIGIWSKN